jgi:hypothetical protein
MCTLSRAEDACQGLTERLTDALENFLDDRWVPHRSGERPSYYLDAPTFDNLTLCDIVAAYNQSVSGTQRLIELAVGRPVQMRHGIHYEDTRHHGIAALVEWDYPEELPEKTATLTELKPATHKGKK